MYTEFLFRNTKRSSFGFTETNLLIYFEKKREKKQLSIYVSIYVVATNLCDAEATAVEAAGE